MHYNYTPQLISPEMCRYVSEEDCEDADMSMKEHVESQKSIQKRRRKNPNLGKIKVLVLMIRFTDHEDRELIPKEQVDAFWQTKVPDWLDLNSQGRYSIEPVVINWQTTDNTEIYYSMGMRGIVPELQKMAWPILDELDNRPNWDWSEFDMDNNGMIDSVVMIHSGYGAETVRPDCFDTEFNNRIWAHAYSSSRNSWKSKDRSIKLNGYTVASAFHGDCGTEAGKIGLTTHEYMHTMGLEDLYDGRDPLAASGVGAFDIMAFPYGQAGNADIPGHLSIWSKVLAEWAEPIVLDQGGRFALKASEISDEAYRINLSDPGELHAEYLLIENRQPLEFDINIWSSGLVIYHIDDAADLQKNLGFPGQAGWPENGNHYQVALLPKDGNYNLEKGKNSGDASDMWAPGDVLGPGEGNTVFPNTDRYQNGIVSETGIRIEVLSQEGTDVTFCVTGLAPDDSCEVEMVAATSSPTVAPSARIATANPTIGSATGIPTLVPTLEEMGLIGNTKPKPLTKRPSLQAVPTAGEPYLDRYGPYEEKPSTAYLSTFNSSIPLPGEDAYLSTFDSVSNLRGNDTAALMKDKPDAKGFIAMAFETLVTLGGATKPSQEHPNTGHYFYSKKSEVHAERNPEEDTISLISTEKGRGHVFIAVGEEHDGTAYSASSSLWTPKQRLLSFACSSLMCYFAIA